MSERARALFADRDSPERDVAYQALTGLFELTEKQVEWAYEFWDRLLAARGLEEGDPLIRADRAPQPPSSARISAASAESPRAS